MQPKDIVPGEAAPGKCRSRFWMGDKALSCDDFGLVG